MEAERFAHEKMREHWIAVPREETKRAKRYAARKIQQALDRGAKRMLLAVDYPAMPGNRLRSVRPVRIPILSVAQLVCAGGCRRRMGAGGQIHSGTVTVDASIGSGGHAPTGYRAGRIVGVLNRNS